MAKLSKKMVAGIVTTSLSLCIGATFGAGVYIGSTATLVNPVNPASSLDNISIGVGITNYGQIKASGQTIEQSYDPTLQDLNGGYSTYLSHYNQKGEYVANNYLDWLNYWQNTFKKELVTYRDAIVQQNTAHPNPINESIIKKYNQQLSQMNRLGSAYYEFVVGLSICGLSLIGLLIGLSLIFKNIPKKD